MKSLILIGVSAALAVSTASHAFAWGAVHGAYGGAAYRGPMGGAAVRGPAGNTAYRTPGGAYGERITAVIMADTTAAITAAVMAIQPAQLRRAWPLAR